MYLSKLMGSNSLFVIIVASYKKKLIQVHPAVDKAFLGGFHSHGGTPIYWWFKHV